jgi:hypothetical protein
MLAIVPVDEGFHPSALTAHAMLTSQYFAHCARYGWYILPSVLTCCPGLMTMPCEGMTYTMGGTREGTIEAPISLPESRMLRRET